MKLFRNRYRIVTDRYCGYEAQIKEWWCPIFHQIDDCNTHITIKNAEEYIEKRLKNDSFKSRVVKELE